MKRLASSEVQSKFGEVLDIAKRDPVTVTQYGRPVVMMMGYEEGLETLRLKAAQALCEFLNKLPQYPEAEALSEDDINRLVHELRP